MSWKSIVTAGLLCVLAVPAFAVPTLSVTNTGGTVGTNGHLDASGNWVWTVAITPTGGSSVAAELGFDVNTDLGSATKNGTNFDRDNPGTVIFGWETLTDQGGGNMRPQGLQTNAANDQVFSALGGPIVPGATPQEYITILAQGPSAAGGPVLERLTSTVQWLGVFGSGDDGRIAETIGGTSTKYDTFNGSASFTVVQADSNFDNSIDGFDLNAWLFSTGTSWQQGDYVDDNSLDGFDFNAWLFSPGPGAGTGGLASATPEPTTAVLVLLGGLFVTALRRGRK